MRWYNAAILVIVMMIRCMKGAIRVPNRGTIRRGVRQPNFVANGGVRSKYMASRVAINEKLPDYRTVLAEMNSVNVNRGDPTSVQTLLWPRSLFHWRT